MTIQHYQPFVMFGRSHLIVLGLSVVVPLILAGLARIRPQAKRAICWIFATIIVVDWVAWYIVFYRTGWLDRGNVLPMDLCSWAAIAVIAALLRPSQKPYELAYFWTMAGTTQGVITPDIQFDFPEFRFIEFSTFHAAIIGAVIFLTFGLRLRPVPASLPRTIGWSLIYMAAAGAVDWALKVNYGFLRAKPGHASPYDLMPAWPWYIPVVVVLALVSVLILYSPFFVIDLTKRLRHQPISRP